MINHDINQATTESQVNCASGEDIASTIDGGARDSLAPDSAGGDDTAGACEPPSAPSLPRAQPRASGAMSAAASSAPSQLQFQRMNAAATARETGKRSDLLRYLRLRRRTN